MAKTVVHGADLDLVELALAFDDLRLDASGEVLDPERTPVARFDADGGPVALRPIAPRPELAADDVVPPTDAAVRSASAAVVFDALPTRTQIAGVDSLGEGAVAWVALVGRGRTGVRPGALLGAVRAAAVAWSIRTGRSAPVVAIPWGLGARPERFAVPAPLADADALAAWLARALAVPEAVVLGAGEEHAVLARLEDDAAAAARALLPAEVLPFHRGERSGGAVVLLTGLSGAGKSSIGRAVAARLTADGAAVSALDGDEVRQVLSTDLGFDAADRATNVRRIAWVAARIAHAGGIAIAAPIAPFAAGRAEARRMAEEAGARFVLVHVATPLEVCEARDRKGLYAAARAGRLTDFTGISSPYEPPDDADVVIDASTVPVDAAAEAVLAALAPAPAPLREPG